MHPFARPLAQSSMLGAEGPPGGRPPFGPPRTESGVPPGALPGSTPAVQKPADSYPVSSGLAGAAVGGAALLFLAGYGVYRAVKG